MYFSFDGSKKLLYPFPRGNVFDHASYQYERDRKELGTRGWSVDLVKANFFNFWFCQLRSFFFFNLFGVRLPVDSRGNIVKEDMNAFVFVLILFSFREVGSSIFSNIHSYMTK
jgi:hypothetical protein